MEGLERKLLATFVQSREAWERVRDKINDKVFEDSLYTDLILKLCDEFYTKDEQAKHTDKDVLLAQVASRIENPKHRDMALDLVKQLAALEVSVDNIVDLALELKRKEVGDKLGIAVLNGHDKEAQRRLMDEYQELLEAQSLDETEQEEQYQNVSVQDVIATTINPEALIKIAPKALNDVLGGGALPGHHITVIARPEMGKTAFMCTLIHGFCLQDLDVIYFGNEDPIMQVMQRGMSSITGLTREEIYADPQRVQDLLNRRNWSRARFIPLTPGSLWEIEKYVKRYLPKVVIVDQMRNISSKAGSKVEQLEEVAKGLRNIAKKYGCVVISVTQAGDSASGKAVLGMGDCDSSNTGIPGACDAMIGMGATEEQDKQGMRCLSLSKNKLSGNHQHFYVRIIPQLSRLESI